MKRDGAEGKDETVVVVVVVVKECGGCGTREIERSERDMFRDEKRDVVRCNS